MRPIVCFAGALLLGVSSAAAQTVNFTIDPTQSVQAISPYIYGINASTNTALNLTAVRAGGNRWTAYNWTNNASNAGSDYLYENDDFLSSSSTPGAAVQPILQAAANANQAALITIPINGYVAADESGPVNPSIPPSQSPHFVPEYPTPSADPNPAANHVYENQFIEWVNTNFPNGFATGSKQPIFISLDNEPDLWSSTHPEVHPNPVTYAELVQDSVAYATAVKGVSQNALVFGPVSYGWEGFLTLQNASDSAADNAAIDPNTGKAYGDFISYYLAQMHAASQTAGNRLLDALDVHWYPEATGLNASGVATRITSSDSSPGVVAARLQAPRSLWDPTYVETSWITQDTTNGKGIQLIPRLQGEINANNPGTKLSISEYNYGGGTDISGGIAEADVLGIFGKMGVFNADEWPLLSQEPFILGGMEMFRNYDGKGSAFGDTSISATTSNIQTTSIYASTDSTTPGRMVLVALNKTTGPIAANIVLNNTSQHYTSFAVYQLTSASTLIDGGSVASPAYVNTYPIADLASFSMPGYSVSTIVPLLAAPAGTISDWNTTAASQTDWTAGVNWTPNGSPGFGVADVARFGKTTTISAGATVNLNSNETIAQLVNQNANAWTLASGAPAGSRLTLNEITQSANAALTISAPIYADGSNQLTFDGAGTGQVTTTGATSGNGGQGSSLKFIKSSAGTLEVDGGLSLGAGSSLAVSGGKLRLNLSATVTPSVGSGVTATVSSGATLELAGSVAALASGSNHVKITNNSTATGGGLLITGAGQQVGAINGTGNLVVNSGASLTADGIVQNSLIIGASATVTLAPTDANGLPDLLASSDATNGAAPFGTGISGTTDLLGADGAQTTQSETATSANGSLGSNSAVPEPSGFCLAIAAGISCIFFRRRRP